MNKIKAEDAVLALKKISTSQSAKFVAERLGTDSRAVATALRGPVADGRVGITYRYGGGIALYRFKRLKAKPIDDQIKKGK
jgi:hypothetical protein